MKHTNPCGVAIGKSPIDAFDRALAGDPVSAYGGIFAFNTPIDDATIEKLNSLFFEVLIVPHFTKGQIEKLSIKKIEFYFLSLKLSLIIGNGEAS